MGGSSASAASEVRRSLEGVLRTSLELQQSVAHFRPEQQADVLRKVGELAEGLAAVDRAKDGWPVAVPREALRYADEARDLDLFKRELLSDLDASAASGRGRREALAQYLGDLMQLAAQQYPEEATEYAAALEAAGASMPEPAPLPPPARQTEEPQPPAQVPQPPAQAGAPAPAAEPAPAGAPAPAAAPAPAQEAQQPAGRRPPPQAPPRAR